MNEVVVVVEVEQREGRLETRPYSRHLRRPERFWLEVGVVVGVVVGVLVLNWKQEEWQWDGDWRLGVDSSNSCE